MNRNPVRWIVLVFLLGALTSMLIAFGTALVRPAAVAQRHSGSIWIGSDSIIWSGYCEGGPGWSALTLYGSGGWTEAARDLSVPTPGWVDSTISAFEDWPEDERALVAIGTGWPFVCLSSRCVGRGDHSPVGGVWRSGLGPQSVDWKQWERGWRLKNQIRIVDPADEKWTLPVNVHWIGFVGNTIFWALPWSVPLLLLTLRRRWRRRQGRCEACGYPIGTSAVCTECGVVLESNQACE